MRQADGSLRYANGGTRVIYFEDPDDPQPLPYAGERDLPGVLAPFGLAYDPAADNAVDSTPQLDKGNDKPTRGDES
jgi:hypothetical protein